ncbi:MAG: glutathione S-transferase family protein [Planctomycetota bacterium]
MSDVTVYGFETSNNMKVRVALGLKGIPYRFRAIDPADRDEVLRVSRQRLTPVLVHGEVSLSDSAAILRYLDANFAQGPRLYGESMAEQWEIDDWELFARTKLASPMLELVHARIQGHPLDAAGEARCAAAFEAAVNELAARLAGREWLVGSAISAADVTAAPVLHRIRVGKLLPWPAAAVALEPWIARVMAYDGQARID